MDSLGVGQGMHAPRMYIYAWFLVLVKYIYYTSSRESIYTRGVACEAHRRSFNYSPRKSGPGPECWAMGCIAAEVCCVPFGGLLGFELDNGYWRCCPMQGRS